MKWPSNWTDEPHIWYVNDGPEVFVVLKGEVRMHTRSAEGEAVQLLGEGDIFHISAGDEHVAHPRGIARVLVIETPDSI